MQKSNRKFYAAALLGLVGVAWSAVDIDYAPTIQDVEKVITWWDPVTQGPIKKMVKETTYTSVKYANNTTAPYRVGFRLYAPECITAGNSGGQITTSPRCDLFNSLKFTDFGWVQFDGLPAGSSGSMVWNTGPKLINKADVLLKTGSCNQVPPREDALPIKDTNELKTLMANSDYYNSAYRYKDGDYLGKHGGLYSAGMLDTYIGETQFQMAIPTQGFVVSNTNVTFNPNNGGAGSMMWMALTMGQEYFGMDHQWVIATGMKETFFMTSSAGQYVNDASGYTPFEIEEPSFNDQVMGTWPTFYPHQLSIQNYLGPAGTSGTNLTDRAWAVNGVLAKTLYNLAVYEQLNKSPMLAWKQVLENSKSGGDPFIGLAIIAFMYNRGPGSVEPARVLLPNQCSSTALGGSGLLNSVLDNPNALIDLSAKGMAGFGNYTKEIRDAVLVLEKASKDAETNPSIQLLERWITKADLMEFWFGIGGNVNTPNDQMVGGLMLQSSMDQATKNLLWQAISDAFDIQARHWPAVNGQPVISLRYDWLANLRIAKKWVDRNVENITLPSWKTNFVKSINDGMNAACKDMDATGERTDNSYPFLSILNTRQVNGELSFEVVAEDPFFTQGSSDPNQQDRGIAGLQWTANSKWTSWRTDGVTLLKEELPRTFGRDTYYRKKTFNVTLSAAEVAQIKASGGAEIYVRVPDLCGNTIVSKTSLSPDPVPNFLAATMFDANGDGVADSLSLNGTDDPSGKANFLSFTNGKLNWYGTLFSFDLTGLGANKSLVSKTGFGAIDDSKKTLSGVVLQYPSITLTPKIFADSVGPAIQSATLKAGVTLDTLTAVFTRPITGIDLNQMLKYFQFKGWAGNASASNLGAPSAILSNDGLNIVFLMPTKSLMAFNSNKPAIPGDSIRINPLGAVVAAGNNKAAQANNRYVSIQYIKGDIKTPDLTDAKMFDTNGDGKADSLYFNGTDNDEYRTPFSSFTDLNLVWYGKNFNAQKSSVVGAYTLLNSFGSVDESKPIGQLSLNYVEGTISKSIEDYVGPVINSASLLKGQSPSANGQIYDTLVLNFNREVSGLNPTQLFPFLNITNLNVNNSVPAELIVVSARTVRLLYPLGLIKAYDPKFPQNSADSVNILPQSALISFKNNLHAAPNNQKVRIELNDGPLGILAGGEHAWFDLNGDGTMDMAQVQFKRTVDEFRLPNMKLTITWLKGVNEVLFTKTYTDADLKINNDLVQIFFGENDSISKYITSMNGDISGVHLNWGTMVVDQPNLDESRKLDTVLMKDRMGPVIVKADLKKTSIPQSRPDYLDLTFSEALDTNMTKGTNIFEYRVSGLDQLIPHSPKMTWRSGGNALQVAFTPDLTERPSVGDSVRFNVQNFTGMAVDIAGNSAHKDHLRRNITGNTVYLISAIPLGKLNVDQFVHRPFAFDTVFSLDRKVNVENFAKTMGYSGFYVRMSFNDIKDSLFERKSDAELKLLRSQFRINVNAQIYSTLGEWVANYNRSLSCLDLQNSAAEDDILLRNACDPRILSPNRDFSLFFPWNFRDYSGRFVGTGVYLLNPTVESSMGVKVKVDKPFSIGVIRE